MATSQQSSRGDRRLSGVVEVTLGPAVVTGYINHEWIGVRKSVVIRQANGHARRHRRLIHHRIKSRWHFGIGEREFDLFTRLEVFAILGFGSKQNNCRGEAQGHAAAQSAGTFSQNLVLAFHGSKGLVHDQ